MISTKTICCFTILLFLVMAPFVFTGCHFSKLLNMNDRSKCTQLKSDPIEVIKEIRKLWLAQKYLDAEATYIDYCHRQRPDDPYYAAKSIIEEYPELCFAQGRYRDAEEGLIKERDKIGPLDEKIVNELYIMSERDDTTGFIPSDPEFEIKCKTIHKMQTLHAVNGQITENYLESGHGNDLKEFFQIKFNHERDGDSLGKLYIHDGEFEKALAFYREIYDYNKKKYPSYDHFVDSLQRIGVVQYLLGDYVNAKESLITAIKVYRSSIAAKTECISESFAYIGRMEEKNQDRIKAQAAYQSALNVLQHSSYREIIGLYKEEADALTQMGYHCLRYQDWGNARQNFEKSIEVRLPSQGPRHPRLGDAYRGLACIYAAQDHLTSATVFAEKALAVQDAELVPTHPRLAATILTLASLRYLEGKNAEALSLMQRLDPIFSKPLALFKDDFIDMAIFWSGVLRSHGKIAEADRLGGILEESRKQR